MWFSYFKLLNLPKSQAIFFCLFIFMKENLYWLIIIIGGDPLSHCVGQSLISTMGYNSPFLQWQQVGTEVLPCSIIHFNFLVTPGTNYVTSTPGPGGISKVLQLHLLLSNIVLREVNWKCFFLTFTWSRFFFALVFTWLKIFFSSSTDLCSWTRYLWAGS